MKNITLQILKWSSHRLKHATQPSKQKYIANIYVNLAIVTAKQTLSTTQKNFRKQANIKHNQAKQITLQVAKKKKNKKKEFNKKTKQKNKKTNNSQYNDEQKQQKKKQKLTCYPFKQLKQKTNSTITLAKSQTKYQ